MKNLLLVENDEFIQLKKDLTNLSDKIIMNKFDLTNSLKKDLKIK